MDIGVELVEAYLRLNGYFTLSEMEITRRLEDGSYQTVTDVDMAAIRFPGDVLVADSHGDSEALLIEDPVLMLEDDTVDVIIGEVKQGPAVFNPGLTEHPTLHGVLQRLEWLYAQGAEEVISGLQDHRVCHTEARGGGRVRTRLVAFGRSPVNDINTIALSHMIETMLTFFERFDDALRPAQLKDPASGFLRLLVKTGFNVERLPPTD